MRITFSIKTKSNLSFFRSLYPLVRQQRHSESQLRLLIFKINGLISPDYFEPIAKTYLKSNVEFDERTSYKSERKITAHVPEESLDPPFTLGLVRLCSKTYFSVDAVTI